MVPSAKALARRLEVSISCVFYNIQCSKHLFAGLSVRELANRMLPLLLFNPATDPSFVQFSDLTLADVSFNAA
jgi:hypothetical protein